MTLLARGLKPFQAEIDATKRRELTDASDLTFGIGTVLVTDPEGNIVEKWLMQCADLHRRQPALDRQSSQITCSRCRWTNQRTRLSSTLEHDAGGQWEVEDDRARRG